MSISTYRLIRKAVVVFRLALMTCAAVAVSGTVARAGVVDSFSSFAQACDVSGAPCSSISSSGNPNVIVFSPDGLSSASTGASDSTSYGSVTLDTVTNACCGPGGGASIHATASFSDEVTISGGTGTGQLSYAVSKSISLGGSQPTDVAQYSLSTTIPLTFTFNQPFSIVMQVSELASVASVGQSGANVTYSLQSISVSDGSGILLNKYLYTDDSGTPYPFVGGSYGIAPEPSSPTLFGTGLLLVVWGACRAKLAW